MNRSGNEDVPQMRPPILCVGPDLPEVRKAGFMTDHSMRLTVEFTRSDGGWQAAWPTILDGKRKFSMDPNKPTSLRIHDETGGWMDFDIERLVLIQRMLVEARAGAKVES